MTDVELNCVRYVATLLNSVYKSNMYVLTGFGIKYQSMVEIP